MILIYCGRLKEIQQSDFRSFPKLVSLDLYDNHIEYLEDGLFAYNSELTYVSFFNNKIIHIGAQVFDNLNKLTWLDLSKNPCINMYAEDETVVREIISQAKIKCLDYSDIDKELQKLENSLLCINSETFPIFDQNLQNLQSCFQSSNLSQSWSLKERFQAITSWKSKNIWTVKEKNSSTETAVANSTSAILNQISRLKTDLTTMTATHDGIKNSLNDIKTVITSQISTLNEQIIQKTAELDKSINEIIITLETNLKGKEVNITNDVNSRTFNMSERITNIETATNNGITSIKDELASEITTMNAKISNLTSILQDFIQTSTRSSNQFQSELKDRLQITNYKIDKSSIIQDYSKSMLIGSCALLITLVLVIIYKKILTRPDDLDY